jgi:hypothetical protein
VYNVPTASKRNDATTGKLRILHAASVDSAKATIHRLSFLLTSVASWATKTPKPTAAVSGITLHLLLLI